MREKRKVNDLKKTEVGITSRSYQRKTVYNTMLVWRISNFEELSCNTMHFQLYENYKMRGVLRLFKHKEILHLSLTNAMVFTNSPSEFSIIDETNNKSITERAEQFRDGVVVAMFLYEKFLSPNSNFLTNGILTVAFKYVSDYFTYCRDVSENEPILLMNWGELCYNLKRMYLDSLYPDFSIHLKGTVVKCHRMILIARSNFFHKILTFSKRKTEYRMTLDVSPGILHQVLLYMYCGELMEMNDDCMLQVYKLAIFFEIKSLCRKCLDYIKRELDYYNHIQFCKFAARFKLTEMKNVIVHVANEEFPEINVLEIFKVMDRETASGASVPTSVDEKDLNEKSR